MLIGVCGGSASGKTTIAKKIIDSVGEENIVYLQQDNYYHDLEHLPEHSRHHINFDHPDSLDLELLIKHTQDLLEAKSIAQPIYDFSKHTRTGKFQTITPKPIILLDGLLIFSEQRLRDLMKIKIFVDTDDDLRFIRRLQRDIAERGRDKESVIYQYLTYVKPMHNKLVAPSKQYADLIISGNKENHVVVNMFVAWVKSLIS
ncbi:MAG: uridine kinase [Acidobacteria bacterium]|nr:uridine kinase [Acidobacteriota bacterium]